MKVNINIKKLAPRISLVSASTIVPCIFLSRPSNDQFREYVIINSTEQAVDISKQLIQTNDKDAWITNEKYMRNIPVNQVESAFKSKPFRDSYHKMKGDKVNNGKKLLHLCTKLINSPENAKNIKVRKDIWRYCCRMPQVLKVKVPN